MFNCKKLFKLQIRPTNLILSITTSHDRWIFPSQSWEVRNTIVIIVNLLYFVDAEYRIWYSDSVQTRRSGVRILAGARGFSPKRPDRPLDPIPSHLPFRGYRGSSSGVKRPGLEVHHSPLTIAKVKNKWRRNFAPPLRGGKFYFLFALGEILVWNN